MRCLQKDRWFNLDSSGPPDTRFSVNLDNPKIWAEPSVALELADQILEALIQDEHEW
jgi:hypothetical protein